MATQLYANPERESALSLVLGRMLQILLSAPFDIHMWQQRAQFECITCVSSMLKTLISMHMPDDRAVPTALGLQLAKQLQQAGFLGSLATYMHHVSDIIRQGLAGIAQKPANMQ